MSTLNADLAAWGEPPATKAEEKLARLLDETMKRLERGQGESLRSAANGSVEIGNQDQDLWKTVSLVYECAASVWENSWVDREAPLNAPMSTPPCLPDPFPGEFRFLRLLGEGAYGKVYLADDLNLGRQVAIKTLKLPVTSTMGPAILAALKKEAKHLAQLNHPNIVRVHQWRDTAGESYLVLQLVAGGSLADRLRRQKSISWQVAARYIADVGQAVVEAHRRGVIHRDIKPENILWDAERDEAMLTDFGVSARLAEPGTIAGTPVYMAPEAFEGHVSPALDVYSLAATLYRLVTGKLPFTNASMPELLRQKQAGLPTPDPNCKVVPEQLEQIIRTGLASDSSARPPAVDFIGKLRASLNHLLADALASTASLAPQQRQIVDLHLVVSRRIAGDHYEPVATAHPISHGLTRDMKKVPRSPDQVVLRTGDQVRIEVTADQTGHVTVFNIGPTGNLNLLYPEETTADDSLPNVRANQTLHVLDVEMEPPTGHERVFAVWSRNPFPLRLEELRSFSDQGKNPGSRPYHSSRDMKRVRESVSQFRPEDWLAVVLELEHRV